MNEDKGYVITASIRNATHLKCDEIWQITRSDKTLPGALWVPDLAPSWDLFNEYSHNWKDKPPEDWWPEYMKRFNEELNSKVKLQALRRLWVQAQHGKVIALVCFCPDNAYCHRRLVGEFLEKQGLRVEEFKLPTSYQTESVLQMALFESV